MPAHFIDLDRIPTAPRRPRYFMYARYSGEGQHDGSSEERQLDMEWHRQEAERLGADVVEVPYVDRAASGFYGDHLEAELGKVLADIKSGVILPGDYLYAESHSRLGRLLPMEAIDIYSGILKAGIKLDIGGTVRDWEVINDPKGLGILIQDFIGIFLAYQHSLELSRTLQKTNAMKRNQVRAGIRQRVMKKGGPGWSVGRRCPAWLEPVSEPVLIDGVEYMYIVVDQVAAIVRMIFQWADNGIGTETIARQLNERNIAPLGQHYRTKKPLKNGWSHGSVRHLLRNRAIIGEYQPHIRAKRQKVKEGEPIPTYYPPLFTEDADLFWRVQDALTKRNWTGGKGRNGKRFTNIIKGLGWCRCCHGTVTLKSYPPTRKNRKGESVARKGTLSYLRCENARRGTILAEGPLDGRQCHNNDGFPYSRFESLLFALFNHDMRPLLAKLTPSPSIEQGDQPSRVKLAELHRQIENKKAAHHEREVELDDLTGDERRASRARMRELLVEIAALESKRDLLAQSLRDTERLGREDFDDRVRLGIARVRSGDVGDQFAARAALHAMLMERVDVVLGTGHELTVGLRGDRRTGFVTFTPDRILDAGTLDGDGRRVSSFDDIWIKLAEIAMGLEDSREHRARLSGMIDAAIEADPNIQDAVAIVRAAKRGQPSEVPESA